MTPMPLSAALQKHFPDGGVTLSTMQNAIRQGKLNCSRLGRVYMVTAEDIQDWMKSCRVEKKQGSISASEKAENQDGSFLTADANTQQAIAEAIGRRLRGSSSMNTSRQGSAPTLAKVIRPKFRSRKS